MYKEESLRLYQGFPGDSERRTPPNHQACPRLPPGNSQETPSLHRTNDSIVIQLDLQFYEEANSTKKYINNNSPDSHRDLNKIIYCS